MRHPFLPASVHHAGSATIDADRSSKASLRALLAAAALLVATGIFVLMRPAHAGIGDIFALGIAWIFNIFTGWLGQLLLIVVNGLIWVAQYNDFVNSAPVANGWAIVRDVTNMFFILVLLVIAFGTILGVEAYSYRNKMLSRLLIMAVVVNFSRTICGLLIDFAQVVMLTFVYGFKEAAGGNFADALRITAVMQPRTITSEISRSGDDISSWTIAVAMIMAFFLVLISLVVVVLMTITLAIRIVYLWLLIVLSPLAFFLKAVPGNSASGYYGMWWKMFTGQVIVGPVMAFFLWLSLVSVASNQLTATGFPKQHTGGGPESVSGPISQAFTDTEIESFIIAICLLMGGLQLSKQISSESAGAAPGLAKKGMNLAKRGAQSLYKGSPTIQRGVDSALSGATKMGVPLARSALIATRKGREAEMKKEQGDQKYLRPDEISSRAQQGKFGMYSGTGAMVEQKEALRNKLQRDAEKGPGKDAKPDDVAKFRDQHFKQKKELKALGGKLMDTSVDKDLADMEKKRPSLIIDEKEKDLGERARQEEKFRGVARGVNASKINDMSADELDPRFLAFANPKAILEAQKNASGDQYDKLKEMGDSEEKIRAKQNEYRARPESFGIMSGKEREDLLKSMDLSGGPPGGDKGKFVDRMAAQVDPSALKDKENKDTDIAKQIAAGISDSALSKLPDNVANALRPLVAQRDMGRAVMGGADLTQALGKSYDSVNGNLDAAGKDRFTQALQATPDMAASVPRDALTKNDGMNDVAIAVANNVEGAQINAMVDGGKNDQAAALADIADKLSKMSTLTDDDIKQLISDSGMSSTLDEVKESIKNSKQVLDEVKSQSSPMNAEMRQQQIVNRISGNEERTAARLEGTEKRITGKKRSRPKG